MNKKQSININKEDFIFINFDEYITNEKGKKNTLSFLTNLISKFINNFMSYHNKMNNKYIFEMNEEQSKVFLLPALQSITGGACMTNHYLNNNINREKKDLKKCDFFGIYNMSGYFIDYKYGLLNLSNYRFNKLKDSEEKLKEWSENLRGNLFELESQLKKNGTYINRGAYSISLYIIVIENKNNMESLLKNNMSEIQNKIINLTRSNAAYYWKIPKNMIGDVIYNYREGTYNYPGILFCFDVCEIEKNK